jgi:hypothetical protein
MPLLKHALLGYPFDIKRYSMVSQGDITPFSLAPDVWRPVQKDVNQGFH